jgi:hypothetical protein
MDDPGVGKIDHLHASGSVAGGGLLGTFDTYSDGDRERSSESLGPRSEDELRLGDRVWRREADGAVRELRGLLLRRDRTQRIIDSGDFAAHPEYCKPHGISDVRGRQAYALDVTAPGGETETVYIDAENGLLQRVAFDDDDGRTTIDFMDYRDLDGHRLPFRTVQSDGDSAFDEVETTRSVNIHLPFPDAVFAPFVSRSIDIPGVETIALSESEGHYFVPVRIGGGMYRFLLDSGAQNVLLDSAVAARIGLAPVGSLEASGASRIGRLKVAKLAELSVGDGKLRNLVVTTLDLGASTGGAFRIDGILGFPFFAAAAVQIDFARKTMTFGPPGSIAPRGTKLDVDTDRGIPEALVTLDGTMNARAIVDTGNAGTLLLYKPFVDSNPSVVPSTLTSRRSFGIGGSVDSYRSSLDEIRFGDISLYHAETDVMLATRGAFADRVDAGNVGLGLLRKFVVTFDLSRGELSLERGANYDDGRFAQASATAPEKIP